MPAASAAITPVDLHSYSAWKQEAGDRVAVAGGSRMTLGRRAILELPLALPAASSEGCADDMGPGAEFEPVSPLDVPAFLRRQAE
jgi:hypothetical protein